MTRSLKLNLHPRKLSGWNLNNWFCRCFSFSKEHCQVPAVSFWGVHFITRHIYSTVFLWCFFAPGSAFWFLSCLLVNSRLLEGLIGWVLSLWFLNWAPYNLLLLWLINHRFPLVSPYSTLISWGCMLGRGRLTSHDFETIMQHGSCLG